MCSKTTGTTTSSSQAMLYNIHHWVFSSIISYQKLLVLNHFKTQPVHKQPSCCILDRYVVRVYNVLSDIIHQSPLLHALPRWSGLPICIKVQSTTTSSRDHAWTDNSSPQTEIKSISRDDALSLLLFVIHGSNKTNSGFFPCVSTASDKCCGKNGQDKSLGDTLHKEHSMLRILVGLCGFVR